MARVILSPGHRGFAVQRGGEVVRLDGRVGVGVGMLDADAASALRAELAHRRRERREAVQALARFVGAQGLEMELDVGRLQLRAGAGEGVDLARAHAHRPAAPQDVLDPDEHLAQGVVHFGVEGRPRALVHRAKLEVVLEVPADAGQVVHRLDPVPSDQVRRPHPRELEDLRRADRTGAKQHLRPRQGLMRLRADRIAHPGRTPVLEAQAVHVGAGDDLQVGAPAGGAKVAGRGAASETLAHGELEVARALLARPVDVVVAGDPDLLRAGR